MKRPFAFLSCFLLFFFSIDSVNGQSKAPANEVIQAEIIDEEEGPAMFKFEPNYLISKEKRREEMAQIRRILDTLDVSENKRRKLLRDLYKNGYTKRLSKVLIVENKYVDIEE